MLIKSMFLALGLSALSLSAHADGGGDVPAQKWLNSIESTKSRAEVRAELARPLSQFRSGDDRGAVRFVRSIRSTKDDDAEIAEGQASRTHDLFYSGA